MVINTKPYAIRIGVVTVFVPVKSLLISTKRHGVTSQKNATLKFTALGTSSLSL
jgi:hypothetical protein